MIRPSPNELERLKNEEMAKRRLLRLKEVREYSKANASKLRNLYKEQKIKVLNKIAYSIQQQFNIEDEKKLDELKLKHAYQINSFGKGHDNASDWVDPSIAVNEQLDINRDCAEKRHRIALQILNEQKQEQQLKEMARLKAMQIAMLIEKERAVEIANLPPPDLPLYLKESLKNCEDVTPRVKVCDRSKFSVIESFETSSYNVQRMNSDDQIFNYEADNAVTAGELRQNHMTKMSTDLHVQAEEQFIKAHLRGHKAIKKQLVHKDYQELVSDLEHVAKGEMAKRQREYHKNELIGPNSAGHLGVGHNAAMMMYKEKCRERAVEAAVMESLKDITNSAKLNAKECDTSLLQNKTNIENRPPESQHKLTNLYDKIRKQKENVRFQEDILHSSPSPVDNAEINPTITDRNNKVISSNLEESEKSDSVVNIYNQDGKKSNHIIQHALSATGRSNALLEKSSFQKERYHLEEDIIEIDRRRNCLPPSNCVHQKTVSVLSESIIETNSQSGLSDQNMLPSEMSTSTESRSVGTEETESVSKIREFQKRALMKLNGQLNMSQIYTLERQISNFSMDTSSLTERSVIKSSSDSTRSHIESNQFSTEQSQSIVGDWVNNQLRQTIEKIPDWVTRCDPKFPPDLNVSFKSSILNIRSSNSSLKSDLQSSFTTICSPARSCNIQIQPSLTEISTVKDNSFCEQRYDEIYKHDMNSSRENLSNNSCNSSVLFHSHARNNDTVINLPENNINHHLSSSSINESSKDLIDFRSMESFSILDDQEYTILKSKQMQPPNIDSQFHQNMSFFSRNKEDDILSNHMSNSSLKSLDETHFECNNTSSSNLSNISTQPTVRQYGINNDNAKHLISEYEQFLNAIVNKIVISKSEEHLTNIGNNSLNSTSESESLAIKSLNSFEQNEGTENDIEKFSKPEPISEQIQNDIDISDTINLESENDKDKNNNKALTDNQLSENTLLNFNNKNHTQNHMEIDKIKNITESINRTEQLESLECIDNNYFRINSKELEPENISEFTHLSDKNKNQELPSISSTVSAFSNKDLISFRSNQSIVTNECNVIKSDQFPQCNFNKTDSLSCISDDLIPLSSISSNAESTLVCKKIPPKNIQNILSSTMKSNKIHVLPSSPDVSTIYSESSAQIKQRILKEYFEKNKERIQAAFSNSTSSKQSSKPADFDENETPRNPDSGKASSRYTGDHSGESTARMTNDDIFITPRNDSIITEFTVRDEWSTSHSNFQPLSECFSVQGNENFSKFDNSDHCPLNLSEETIKNHSCANTKVSVDLMDFNSMTDLRQIPVANCSNISSNEVLFTNQQVTPSSQQLSAMSNITSSLERNLIEEDNDYSEKSTTECSSSSLKYLESFHSSAESNFNILTTTQIREFETNLHQLDNKNETSCSIDSKSDMDTSNLSLVSFLRNESVCQKLSLSNSEINSESTPKRVIIKSIDNNEEMKNQLEKWKKERLMRINTNPPNDAKKHHITKDENARHKDNIETKSRTLKLWNKLEEVQKVKQQKEAEQMKMENQLRKKQYAEKLRRIKMDKQKKKDK